MKQTDTFMRDEVHAPKHVTLTYWDGLRFGFGFMMAHLLGFALVGGIAYTVAVMLHLT